jgi:hypothetical protein
LVYQYMTEEDARDDGRADLIRGRSDGTVAD